MELEKFAIRAAKGNNGGEWATHYNEDQKNYWRQFVRDLIEDLTPIRPQVTGMEKDELDWLKNSDHPLAVYKRGLWRVVFEALQKHGFARAWLLGKRINELNVADFLDKPWLTL